MNGLALALAGVVMDALPGSLAVPGRDLAQCALPAAATCSLATLPRSEQSHIPLGTLSGGTGGQGVKGAPLPGPAAVWLTAPLCYNQSQYDIVNEGEMNLR